MRHCAPKRGVREMLPLNNSILAIEDKTPSGQPIVGREKVCQLVSSWNHQSRKKKLLFLSARSMARSAFVKISRSIGREDTLLT